jgi:hypothetical protein
LGFITEETVLIKSGGLLARKNRAKAPSQKYRNLPTKHRQSLVSQWANSSLAIAWPFTEVFREAD